ncbi:MAG: pyridoxamine 5'-phosphate oxidase family protein [Pyrinomonadaceae bacterium]
MSEIINPTEKTKIKRLPKRGNFERASVYKILDEGFVCHVGFAVDEQPFVLPTAYARIDDRLLIHGSAASRMMKAMASEIDICVTVTLVDGLVLARSAFHHSMNYRSVVVFGKAKIINDKAKKLAALRTFIEHIIPHRWSEVRPPTEIELKATTVLALPITEASAKIRAGDPIDDAEDYEMDVWAGVIPFGFSAGKPVVDAKLKSGAKIPPYVSNYKRS